MQPPRHVAMIMDGNRRFSKRLMEKPWKGHEWGREKLEEVIEWCEELGVEELSLYAFSMQNFDRPREEFDYLMELFTTWAEDLLGRSDELSDRGVRIRFLGRIERFPDRVHALMRELMEATADNDDYFLNLCMAYGGREELLDAFREVAEGVVSGEVSPEDIDADLVSEHLYLDSEPDMIIRTGGERRTSNFLVWQSWYSEWFFLDTLWPEFSKEEFLACIEEFNERERRFGR